MKYLIFSLILITQGVAFGDLLAQHSDASDSDIIQKISDYMDKATKKNFSGTVMIVKNGKPLFIDGYGQSDKEQQISNAAETVYDIGSLTKQFTAAAILLLEMQGELAVTDPVAKYLPEFGGQESNISIHQLLTHTAGLPGAIGNDYDEISEAEFIEKAISNISRGTDTPSYEYSNVGYSLLAIIIERVSGKEYETYLSKYLFEPAGMTQTGYYLPDWDEKMVAIGYQDDEAWGKPNAKNWSEKGPFLHLKGNGGILSTVEDMYKWHLALKGDQVLSTEAKSKYLAEHVPEDEEGSSYYGYGWVIIPTKNRGKLITHNGGNGVFFADFWTFPQDDNTVIVLSNSSNRFTEDLALELCRML